MSENPLNDALPARGLIARWVIRGTLTLETAMHLGGEEGERVDMSVLRDPLSGDPLLPGTTLAGALRDALADHLAGYRQEEPSEVAQLFGGARGSDDGDQSPLIVFDAIGELSGEYGVEIRDGVAISPPTGTAEDHKKYDFEVLPAGTRFPVRVDLLVPAPHDGKKVTPEKALLESLAAALNAFSYSDSSFGARRSRGLGCVSALWAARRFDLSSDVGWLKWILSNHCEPFAANPDQSCIRTAIEAAAPDSMKPLSIPEDNRSRVVIDLDLKVVQDILVRSPGTEPGASDVSHLNSGGRAILPGTSLAGVMRSQALRIAKLVREKQKDADTWINCLFGPRFEGRRPSAGSEMHASRLRIGEATIDNGRSRRQTRVAIDRFTGGAADTALFDEQTEVGGQAAVRLELRNRKEGELEGLGLILLVLKDLLDGTLPVGGTSSVGRGVLRGHATVTWQETGKPPRSAKVEPGAPPTGEASDKIDRAIQAFRNAKPFSDRRDRA